MPFRRRNPPPARRRRPRVFKQKQAYKPRQKKRFQRKRQPFVETKKATTMQRQDYVLNEMVIPADATAPRYREWKNCNISPINQFLFMSRGLTKETMVGRDIYSKYLKQKIEITLPTGIPPDTTEPNGESNRPFNRITQPIQIWIVWGWIKKPFGNSDDESGSPVDSADVRDAIDHVTGAGDKLLGNIATRGLRDSDFLTFKDKRKNIWTMNKRLLRPGHTPTSVKPPVGNIHQLSQTDAHGGPTNSISDFGQYKAYHGYPNVLQTSITWKTSRKMRFYPEDSGSGGFARDSWLPYSYILVPKQFQEAANRASPSKYRYPTDMAEPVQQQFYDLVGEMKTSTSMCHWFTDS